MQTRSTVRNLVLVAVILVVIIIFVIRNFADYLTRMVDEHKLILNLSLNLNYSELSFIDNLKSLVNIKFYSIKKVLYLSQSVKVHFFKPLFCLILTIAAHFLCFLLKLLLIALNAFLIFDFIN